MVQRLARNMDKYRFSTQCDRHVFLVLCRLVVGLVIVLGLVWNVPPVEVRADMPLEPVVAIHVSEITQALDDAGSWNTWWHYFVMHESLKEALDSDGIPWVEVSDEDIANGVLLLSDGSPRYPILFSLASEAIQNEEVDALRTYIANGGFLFAGSSAFTRYPNGDARGDFALVEEMGLHSDGAWYQNTQFTKIADQRLVSHIPEGTLNWRMPLSSEEVPWGISPSHGAHTRHYAWSVNVIDAEVIASGSSSALLTTKSYGQGHVIYHSALNPLIGHGGYDSGMYAYLIYRNAIEWAFESANMPIVRLSPWRYQYNAAFVVRHDFENTPSRIRSINASAQAENAAGAKGDYYFCTGTLRVGSEDTGIPESDKPTVIASVQSAVRDYGATIGSHNGGLPNPNNHSLIPTAYDYWHWGSDEALDTDPANLPGYDSGYEYAYTSVLTSFLDIEDWLSGLDNGRVGCGVEDDCPRTWVSPYFNSAREGSYDIMEELGVVSMGEQKLGLFPHWTLSYDTPGRHAHVTLPTSDWYVGNTVAQSMEDRHTATTIRALVDFYYDQGALINLYSHQSSASGNGNVYLTYVASKPSVWATNAVEVYDWWTLRSGVVITPSYTPLGNTGIAMAAVSGAVDPDTAIEMMIPHWDSESVADLQVFLDGALADSTDYRVTDDGLKVRVGTSVSNVRVHYTSLAGWVQTDWVGGDGQSIWADETRYELASGLDDTSEGQVRLSMISGGEVLSSDDFSRPDRDPVPFTWIVPETGVPQWPNRGVFNTDNGWLNAGTSQTGPYGFAYTDTLTIVDHSVEADIRFADSTFMGGGGIFGRLNPGNGQRYAVWIYPDQSRIRLIKYYNNWGNWNSPGFATYTIPGGFDTNWHHLKMTFTGNRIQVFYDGLQIMDVTDDGNAVNCATYNSCDPYTSGLIGVDLWTSTSSGSLNGPSYNNFIVRDNTDQVVFSDDFGPDPIFPWVAHLGTWTLADEVLLGSSMRSQYGYIYTDTVWSDTSVEARIQFPAGAYGGGIGGRLDPATGAHYAAWVYPGSNELKLIKFSTWTVWNTPGFATVTIPAPGTEWHTLKLDFQGNHIRVYYDGNLVVDYTDNSSPYLHGGISADMWTAAGYTGAYGIQVDDVVIRTPGEYGSAGTLLSSAFDGGRGVEWQNIAWSAAAGGSTGVRLRTRAADEVTQLSTAPWSDWYTTNGTPVTSPDLRWIQYQLEMTSSITTTTPVFYEMGITYLTGPGSHLDYTGPTSGESESQVMLSAIHLDDSDAPVVGSQIVFTLDGPAATVTGTTDSHGEIAIPLDLDITPGVYNLVMTFAGTTELSPLSIHQPFTVTSPWSEWVQDTQADFLANTLTDAGVTTSGSVLLEQTLVGEGEEMGSFSIPGEVPPLKGWNQTHWTGGAGQGIWADETRYVSASSIDDSSAGQIGLGWASGGDLLFADNFTRSDPVSFTWIVPDTGSYPNRGEFHTEDGILNTETDPNYYGFAYTNTIAIDNHTIEADIRFPQTTRTVGGGIYGRLNPATGQRYAFWIYPETSSGGSATARIIRFNNWGGWTGLAQGSISGGVGTRWHHVRMVFSGNRIEVYYDGASTPLLAATDSTYTSGHIGVDFWNSSTANSVGPFYNNFVVRDSTDQVVFSDDFGPDLLAPWVEQLGTWTVASGVMQGQSVASQYGYVYTGTAWTDYTVEARIQFPAGAFGGGLGGRLNPATGAHYAAWIYPDGSSGGSNVLKLLKFPTWTGSWTLLTQVDLSSVGTNWHTLRLDFQGGRIRVYYDDDLVVDYTDSSSPYLSGGISMDMWTAAGYTGSYGMQVDDVVVRTPGEYASSGTLLSSAFDGGTGVQWQTIGWNGTTDDNTGIRVRTRTADELGQLESAPWSDWYTMSGSPVTNDDRRWIQYQVELTSTDTSITPLLYDINTIYTVTGADLWNYRRRLFIDNNVGSELPAGYSVKVVVDTASLVSANKLRSDGDDLRVVWDDAGTLVELDRVAETAFNTSDTELWFKTQAQIVGDGRDRDYYLYYGNPYAGTPPADPAEVYVLWDDFDGSALDPRWNVTTGSVSVSDGQAHLPINTNIIDTTPYTYTALEARLRLGGENTYVWWGWEEIPSNAANMVIFEESSAGFEAWTRNDNATISRLPIADPAEGLTSWHTYVTDWWPGHARWLIDGAEVESAITNIPDSGIYANFYARSVAMDVDWVKARLRVDQDPTVSIATPWLEYTSTARMVSMAYDTQQFSAWKYFTWDATLPLSTSVNMRVRTAATQAGLVAASWVDYERSGLLVSNDAGRWVQYEATLTTTDPFTTPQLHKVTVYYLDHPVTLMITPEVHSAVAGEVIDYIAGVNDGSQIWDVTDETNFSTTESGHGGSWLGGAYTSHTVGDWTVRGDYPSLGDMASLHVAPGIELWLTKVASPELVRPGDSLTYTITISNAGTLVATDVTMTDTLLGNVTWGPVVSSQGSCSGDSPMICAVGNLVNGDVMTVTFIVTATTVETISNTAIVAGSDPFGNGVTAVDVVSVESVNTPPNALDDSATTSEDASVTIAVLDNDTDADGDDLALESYDAVSAGGSSVTRDDNSTPDDQTDDRLVYTPLLNFYGIDTFTYTVNDGYTGMDTATVTVTVLSDNDPPRAGDNVAATDEDTPVVIAVLANDTDTDGDTLEIAGVGTTGTLGAVIYNQNVVSYTPGAALQHLVPGTTAQDLFTYTVSDRRGGSDTAMVTVTVTGRNDVPVALDDVAVTDEETYVIIDVLTNDDDVDDGDLFGVSAVGSASYGTVVNNVSTVLYIPDTDFTGFDAFTYTIRDILGTMDTATVTVEVRPLHDDPPLGVDDVAKTEEDHAVAIAVLANDTDLDGDDLIVQSVVQPAHGIVIHDGNIITYTPAANFNGQDAFSYVVGDGYGGTDMAAIRITVEPVNDAPVAGDDVIAVDEGGTLILEAPGILHNDSDVEGDVMTATLISSVAHGMLALDAHGALTYTHDGSESVVDRFTYQISDAFDNGNRVTVTLTINPVNDAPIALEDAYTVDEGDTLSVGAPGVLGNDVDAETDTLHAVLSSGPGYGALILNADGSFVYEHDGGATPHDTFTYRAYDGVTHSEVVTVWLTIGAVNDAPVALNDTYAVDEGTTLIIEAPGVLTNDTDAENDVISATLLSTPSHGTLTFTHDGAFIYAHDGSETLEDNFVYQVRDSLDTGNVATVTLVINPLNDLPEVFPDTYSVNEGSTLIVSTATGVLANDTDVDNEYLTVALVQNVAYGMLTLNEDGSFIYMHDGTETMSDSFVYEVYDGLAYSDAMTVSITVRPVNDAPVAISDTYGVDEGGILAVSVPGVLANDTDAEGDILTATLGVSPLYGTVILDSSGGFIYTHDGSESNGTGSPYDSFTYIARDAMDNSESVRVTIIINPINDVPMARNDAYSLDERGTLVVDAVSGVLANDEDPDSDILTATLVNAPDDGTVILTANGAFTYTHSGTGTRDSFTYQISDKVSVGNIATVTLDVNGINDAPEAVDDVASLDEDMTLVITVLDNDHDIDGDVLTVMTVGQPAHGTVMNYRSNVAYIPVADFHGEDAFSYVVTDGVLTDTAMVYVNVVALNDVPEAHDDSAVTDEDVNVLIDVLSNDVDVDGDALTVSSIIQPAHGTASVNEYGGVEYIPGVNFNGEDRFTYIVGDGHNATDMGLVIVTVSPVNDAPLFKSTPVTAASPELLYHYAVIAEDIDLNEVLTISAEDLPAWLALIDHGDGTAILEGTPAMEDQGTYCLTLEVADLAGASDQQSFCIVVEDLNVVGEEYTIYLPLTFRNYRQGVTTVIGPDLVVTSIVAVRDNVQVVIENQGDTQVEQAFWVQVYISPNPAPTQVNQLWYVLGKEGLVWGVTVPEIPLRPGEVITLTYGDSYYWTENSRFEANLSVGTAVYAQVDAYNVETMYGAVLEGHERLGEPYNNITGPVYVTSGGRITDSESTFPAGISQVDSNGYRPADYRLPAFPSYE
ncbi:MAG: tandem-95 repeat protein [Anaerolineae bacterium]|nr:tandem-95 repeat protein [Anaerolineae bacterium]